jgi:GTP-binding protein
MLKYSIMLIDRIKIKVKSGDGGNGLLSFDRRQKAYGGDGGKGGDVIIVGDENIYDLSHLNSEKTYKAQNGEKGGIYRRAGKDGDDLLIKVPLVTRVLDSNQEQLAVISTQKQKYKILNGGNGGLGNYSLRGSHREGKYSRKRGQDGQEQRILLELNLKSDAILLGLPNAGKSSLINALTRAKSKVGSYEFTTLEPQLGVMDGYIKLMDLPGLIEGTHEGKGVGKKFLKHTKYSKLLIHCISLENEDIVNAYRSMREEFKKISEELCKMDELIVITKADIYTSQKGQEVKHSFTEKIGKDAVLVSTYLKDTLIELDKAIRSKLDSHQS